MWVVVFMILDIHNVTFSYESMKSELLFKDIHFRVRPGEWVSLMGASGTGKTTLLQIIGGNIDPASGKVLVLETDIFQLNDNNRQDFKRNHIGFVFQDFRLLPTLNVLENVMLPFLPYEKRSVLVAEAEKWIERVGLSHRIYHLPAALSGGEQQRVAIARALLNNPALLLCDEPTGNLDVKNRDSILALLQSLHREGVTIFIVTHDPEVAAYGERVYHLQKNRIWEGTI